jgi:hypothetical protein
VIPFLPSLAVNESYPYTCHVKRRPSEWCHCQLKVLYTLYWHHMILCESELSIELHSKYKPGHFHDTLLALSRLILLQWHSHESTDPLFNESLSTSYMF